MRFCIDFRKINAISRFDTYPMPLVDELLEWLGSAEFISTLDLTKGYWQIPLALASYEKVAFPTLLRLIPICHDAMWTAQGHSHLPAADESNITARKLVHGCIL